MMDAALRLHLEKHKKSIALLKEIGMSIHFFNSFLSANVFLPQVSIWKILVSTVMLKTMMTAMVFSIGKFNG